MSERQRAKIVRTSHFVIEYVEPATEERRWAKNCSLDLVCETAERAIELLRTVSPEGRIDVVRRVGTNRALLIDPLHSDGSEGGS